MMFIDTNYFLRYLLNDISEQHEEAKKVFLAGSEGKAELMTSSVVIFEIVWVLGSFYGVEKRGVVEALGKILQLSFIELEERDIFAHALPLFEKTNLSLEDCYNIYYARSRGVKSDSFKTFDKKLEKEVSR